MSTPGEILVETLASVYTYSAPRRHPSVTTSTTPYSPTLAPTLNRVPAFLRLARGLDDRLISSLSHTFTSDIETRSIRVDAIEKMCRNFDDDVEPTFSSMKITTEADVTHVMSYVARDVSGITFKGYRCSLQDQVKHPLIDQTPDHVLTYNGTRRVVWEDEGWSVFEHCAPSIVALARGEGGKRLQRNSIEEGARAMLYKLAVAMFDCQLWWGILFGGDHLILFQRVVSTESTRYGLLCSEILPIDRLCLLTLGTLLVPGSVPLVDVASFEIPVPPACPPSNLPTLTWDCAYQLNKDEDLGRLMSLEVSFVIDGYEPTTVKLSPSSFMDVSSSLPSDFPHLPTPPHETNPVEDGLKPLQLPPHRALTLHIDKYISIGATGAVFAASVGPLALVVKAIPPRWKGKSDLCHEAHMYDVLASLQGHVLPRMLGFFEGEGWTMLVLEHCGKMVTDLDMLSEEQRRILWRHACEIHANGVLHADLELRNLVVSRSGDVRIVDYAFSKGGHKCNGDTCEELCEFRRLLALT